MALDSFAIKALLVLMLAISLGASAAETAPTPTPRSRYYADVDSPFYLGGTVELPGVGFSLIPRASSGILGLDRNLRYRPATQFIYGINGRYKLLGGGISFTLPIFGFQATEGKSTRQDYRINYYGRAWGVEVSYSEWKGYLIDGLRGLGGEEHYLLPDLKNVGGGAVFYFVLSPDRYSLGASFDQRQRQLISASSFFLVGSFRYQEFRSPVQIIPVSKQSDFASDATLRKSTVKSVAGGIGWGLHLVLADLFLSTAVIAEVGHQWTDYVLASGSVGNTFIGLNGRVRVGVGHNGKTFLAGLNVYVDAFTEATRDILILNVGYSAQVFLGFRF